jgi:hypothetical protein
VRLKSVSLLLVAFIAALVVAGCGGGDKKSNTSSTSTTNTSTTTTSKPVGAPGAKVSFLAPADGATVGGTVTAKVKLSKFKLAPNQVGKPAKQGQGHLHFSLDGGKYDYPKYSGANGKLATSLGVQGKYSPSVTPTITYKGLPAGKHKLEVYLANNDHTNTGVEAATSFTVKPGSTSGGAAAGGGGPSY